MGESSDDDFKGGPSRPKKAAAVPGGRRGRRRPGKKAAAAAAGQEPSAEAPQEVVAEPALERPQPSQGAEGLGQAELPVEGATADQPSGHHSAALALVLQDETKQERAKSLEEIGLVFCQLCQKDLSTMNTVRREQHVNRCLDDIEKQNPHPAVPECPICGRGFSTQKSRGSHLKRCAARWEIPPHLLVQAVREQAFALGNDCPTAIRGLKRTGSSSSMENPMKKRKAAAKTKVPDEDLLVAMAMSQSLLEEEKAKSKWGASWSRDNIWPGRRRRRRRNNPKAERETGANRPRSPPPLLLQDAERGRQQMEERMAFLLAEAEGFPSTPVLPTSRLGETELSRKKDGPLASHGSLWEFSSLQGPCAPASFCAVGFAVLISPQKRPDQKPALGTVWPLSGPSVPNADAACLHASREQREDNSACSQQDAKTLQDLTELAGEGLTLTQWNLDLQQVEGSELLGDALQTHLDQSLEKEPAQRSCQQTVLLDSLAGDFREMVNNPHWSDVQFQVDSGEVLYAHMFVLYARCQQLVEAVDRHGFLVAEGGSPATRRLLLSDVPREAAHVFLNYLYTADSFVPEHLLSDVSSLARRFGVGELAAVCGTYPSSSQGQSGVRVCGVGEKEEGSKDHGTENLEELLKSIWRKEEEETEVFLRNECKEAGDEKLGEEELEEIYDFVATQHKSRTEERRCRGNWNGVRQMDQVRACPGNDSQQGAGLEGPATAMADAVEEHTARREESLTEPPLEERLAARSKPDTEEETFAVTHGGHSEPSQLSCGARKSATPHGSQEHLPVASMLSSGPFNNLDIQPPTLLPASPQFGRFSSEPSQAIAAGPSPPRSSTAGKFVLLQSKGQGHSRKEKLASLGEVPVCNPDPLLHLSHRKVPGESIVLSSSDDEAELSQRKGQVEAGQDPWSKRCLDAAICSRKSLPLHSSAGSDQRTGQPLQKLPIWGEAHPQGDSPQFLRLSSDEEASQDEGQVERTLVPDTQSLSVSPTAEPSLESGCENARIGRSQDLPAASIPSSEKGALPVGHRSSAEEEEVVVVVDDSEEEDELLPSFWNSNLASTPHPPLAELEEFGAAKSSPIQGAISQRGSLPGALAMSDATLLRGSPAANGTRWLWFGAAESADSSRLNVLDWSGRDQDSDGVLPFTQRLAVAVPVPKTPEAVCQDKEIQCMTPVTPMPSYSIMETPELKKELNRFGVRVLPKRQMVLKLKEIFQYTHPSLQPISKDKAASSQPILHPSTRKRTLIAPCSPVASSSLKVHLGALESTADTQSFQAGSGWPKGGDFSIGDGMDDHSLTASPGFSGSSVAGGDGASGYQSSSPMAVWTTAPAEGEEDYIPSSQAAASEVDKLEALRQYIHSKPALHRQILLYQPFELAGLQAELKQNGIRIALGKLLDFLDAHCITFTTAESRKEKQQQRGLKRKGRRRY